MANPNIALDSQSEAATSSGKKNNSSYALVAAFSLAVSACATQYTPRTFLEEDTRYANGDRRTVIVRTLPEGCFREITMAKGNGKLAEHSIKRIHCDALLRYNY